MTEQQLINEGYVDGKKSFDYLFEKIHKYFDWQKVYTVMKALDWCWYMKEDTYAIPNINAIQKSARELLFRVYEKGSGSISTGGFTAGYEDGELWLVFQIEECNTTDL
jgi:hypothetical protein